MQLPVPLDAAGSQLSCCSLVLLLLLGMLCLLLSMLSMLCLLLRMLSMLCLLLSMLCLLLGVLSMLCLMLGVLSMLLSMLCSLLGVLSMLQLHCQLHHCIGGLNGGDLSGILLPHLCTKAELCLTSAFPDT